MEYLAVVFAYFLGSVPFGYLGGRLAKKVDIRDYGSGNIGTTNVLRLMGPLSAVIVLLLDAGKGAAAVLLAGALSEDIHVLLLSAMSVIIGHCFSIFLRFRGGKGVATGMGIMLFIPGFIKAFLLILLIAISIIALTRYVSLGSMVGAVLVPIFFWLFQFSSVHIVFGIFLSGLLIWMHRANLARLLKGTESRLGEKISTKVT